MSYDFEAYEDSSPPTPEITPSDPRDLEAIVTLLELGAIFLTDEPGKTFTTAELLAEAKNIGGDEVPLKDADVQIVFGKAGFLKKVAARRFQLK